MKWIGYFVLLFASSLGCNDERFTPVVLWHGLGDSCCSNHIIDLKNLIKQNKPGICVRSIMIGESIEADKEFSFYGNVNDHVEEVCQMLAKDRKLKNGYHAIGISQGGLFFRAVAQRCPSPPMKNLITIGSPHQGIFGCGYACKYFIQWWFHHLVYYSYFQHKYVSAQYWHDPRKEATYRQHSIFLADVNNEKEINETYRRNLQKLENFVMVKFLRDSVVYPRESQWFGFYAPGQAHVVLPLRETRTYKEDRLGLKQMDNAGKLHFVPVDGDHLHYGGNWFLEEIVKKFIV